MDYELLDVILRSLWVSGAATLLALSWSVPAALAMAARRGSEAAATIAEALVGVPTVVLGLLFYFLLSSSGPLGFLGLLYTPLAMVIGEAALVTPLLVSTSYRVLRRALEEYGELALALGATRLQAVGLALRESARGVAASAVMGFSRAVGELGVALMLGGNIRGYTRVMTTAIALGVSRGEFEESLALGLALVAIMVAASAALKALGAEALRRA